MTRMRGEVPTAPSPQRLPSLVLSGTAKSAQLITPLLLAMRMLVDGLLIIS